MCMFRSSRRKCFNDTSQVTKITSLVGTSDESLSWEGEEMGGFWIHSCVLKLYEMHVHFIDFGALPFPLAF